MLLSCRVLYWNLSLGKYVPSFMMSIERLFNCDSYIIMPYFGYHSEEFTGYYSTEHRSLAPRVHRSESRRPRK